jgi:hypothetical protein
MTTLNAQSILYKTFKGDPNFITPITVKIGKIHKLIAYEISTNNYTGDFDKIYGVSICAVDETGYRLDISRKYSQSFSTLTDAKEYVKILRGKSEEILSSYKPNTQDNQ